MTEGQAWIRAEMARYGGEDLRYMDVLGGFVELGQHLAATYVVDDVAYVCRSNNAKGWRRICGIGPKSDPGLHKSKISHRLSIIFSF